MSAVRIGALLVTVALAAACNRGGSTGETRPLLNLRGSAVAPDEFLVVPQKPLEIPADMASLPEPTPGATPRAQIDSEAELLAALGGRDTGISAVPAADAALVAAARSGAGDTSNIRAVLQAEDAAFRADRARRIAKLTEDARAGDIYDRMLLDALAELARLRALGIKTPSVDLR